MKLVKNQEKNAQNFGEATNISNIYTNTNNNNDSSSKTSMQNFFETK